MFLASAIVLGVSPLFVASDQRPASLLHAQTVSREERRVLADFEDSTEAAWRASGDNGDARPILDIGQIELPPTADSRAYLMVRFMGNTRSGLRLLPPAPIQVRPYVRRLEFWLYGTGAADEVYVDLADQNDGRYRILAARTNFTGWRLITFNPTSQMVQRAKTVVGEGGLVFLGFYVRPHYASGTGLCSIHIDSVTAVVRPYQLRPETDWR